MKRYYLIVVLLIVVNAIFLLNAYNFEPDFFYIFLVILFAFGLIYSILSINKKRLLSIISIVLNAISLLISILVSFAIYLMGPPA
ncbi:hypothetical protein SAMN05444673_3965 [Bacillus sp. OV166]|nr:hypothetical protein SAMN05444673_3965 [Bacillus sp. OV166]